MSTVDQIAINNTLKRVKHSLNVRFEKDAELYISKKDTLIIKEHIYKGEFEALLDMVKANKHSAGIVSRVLGMNLWLLNDISTKESDKIINIFLGSEAKYYDDIKKDIDNGNMDLTTNAKIAFYSAYFVIACEKECLDFLDRDYGVFNEVVIVCFIRLLELNDEPKKKIDIIEKYSHKYNIISQNPFWIKSLIKKLDTQSQNVFLNEIGNSIKQYIMKEEKPPKYFSRTYFEHIGKSSLNWLLTIGNDIDNGKSLNITSYPYSNLKTNEEYGRWKIVITLIRDIIKDTSKNEDILEEYAQILAKDYRIRNHMIKKLYENKLYSKGYYSAEIKAKLILRLEKVIGKLPESLLETYTDKISIFDARELYEALAGLSLKNESAYNHAAFLISKIKTKMKENVIKDFFDKFAKSTSLNSRYYPKIFSTYIKISKTNNDIEPIFKYFNDNFILLDSNPVLKKIEKEIVDTIKKYNIRTGEKEGVIYNYFYNHYRENLIKWD